MLIPVNSFSFNCYSLALVLFLIQNKRKANSYDTNKQTNNSKRDSSNHQTHKISFYETF
jgi:hypothetical protein